MKRTILGLLLAPFMWAAAQSASAGLVIGVDMDPLTPGVQTTLDVTVGATFSVEVFTFEDFLSPPGLFDTVVLETFFNDAGAVLGAGPTGITWIGPAGGLAALAPALALDLFLGLPPSFLPGGAVAGPPGGLFPPGGFSAALGPVGLASAGLPFAGGPLPPLPTSIFSVDFTALMAGTSTIVADGSPFGSPPAAFFGGPVPATIDTGIVTVSPLIVDAPEPGSLLLLGAGLAGLAWRRHRGAIASRD